MDLLMRINAEAEVMEETECKMFDCGSPTGSSSLSTELVKSKTSRKRWPSRTRISAANSVFPQCNPVRWPKMLARMKH